MLRISESAHLISLIDMTQDKYVEKDMVTLWQNSLSEINTSKLKPINQEQKSTSQITQNPSIMHSQLSKSINYNLASCSFQLLVKKQNEKQKKQLQNQNQTSKNNFPKQHRCQFDDTKSVKYTPPKRYQSISSQYSPARLQHYLNQNDSNLNVNKKWLQTSSHRQSHSTQIRVSAQLDPEEIQKNFIDRNRTSQQSVANKHLLLSTKYQNI
ncbi:unnamed protein product (macronuclear) [Paramecium tetraurelia]|uniref:Uncharacterized protein n=1 Tax=Paramecium tetraurelia TaxID=5888 RepID=A0DC45_PARTE|nr:uncharacterized protein GSPATT00015489001 [Paramecium tetraurelia]CAK80612.1 unnamed protein product [Paramecium tetraurelia]|eukprot:XP_001448009.1 hypothetical protein (macronuclear) [Paramecium tetraurelia strain d4-2]